MNRLPRSAHRRGRVVLGAGLSAALTLTLMVAAQPAHANGTYSASVLADTPYLYYPFAGAGGTGIADTSGHGHDATAYGGLVPGGAGPAGDSAITLDGSTGYLSENDTSAAPQNFTTEVWLKTSSTRGGTIASFSSAPTGVSGSHDRQLYMTNDGVVHFGIYSGKTLTIGSTSAYNDGRWHLIDASLGSRGAELTVDGIPVAADTLDHSAAEYTGHWRFGYETLKGWQGSATSWAIAGTLAEAAVYPAQLGTAQIDTHYTSSGRAVTPPTTAQLHITTAAQTMAGFGAAGDWWTVDAQYFPTAMREQIKSLLFSDRGIALSQYRYNIGGGGTGVVNPAGDESELGVTSRAPSTPYVSPAIMDYTKDPGGVEFLKAAAKKGISITAHANSAPAAFTTNNQSCGGTLRADKVSAYADYLAKVVQHAWTAWHVKIAYVSPMNEPDYTRADCTQEGMVVPPSLRGALITAVHDALVTRAPWAKVLGDESSSLAGQFLPELNQWIGGANVRHDLAALVTHTYDYPDAASLAQAAKAAASAGKTLWQTEVCCYADFHTYGAQWDPGIDNALWLANTLSDDLTIGQMSAYDWWVALSPALGCDPATQTSCGSKLNDVGYNDGLVYFNPNFATDHDNRLIPTKRLWALGNYSKFVPPGAIRYGISGLPNSIRASAFKVGSHWRVVAINDAPTAAGPATVQLMLPNGKLASPSAAYRTSATENLQRVGNTHHNCTLVLPSQSITTFIL